MKRRKNKNEENGFEEWGGYMAMKKCKLQEQFTEEAARSGLHKDNLFQGVAIFVNGYTDPSADELRHLMIKHGGMYHHYYRTNQTTHIIATNLPDAKIKQMQNIKVVKPAWITDSIKEKKILDFRDYLLLTNHSKTQPTINFVKHVETTEPVCKSSLIKNATNVKFLSDFYNNSRLHHISTMGALFKQYVNDLRLKSDHKFSGREKLLKKCQVFKQMGNEKSKIVMHIDMDCFFVSVGIRDKTELKGRPVAVTHAKGNRLQPREGMKQEIQIYREKMENKYKNRTNLDNAEEKFVHWTDSLSEMDSMAEIASCSYEARKVGVKNGMFLGQALKLCPSLKPIHYDFEAYKEVSFSLYDTIARYTLDIEAVSCDEMYIDCTELLSVLSMSPLDFATELRNEIKMKTRCPCSVGFGENRLQARIATKKAKPDGQFYLQDDPEIFFHNILVSDLPGVGYSTTYKLKNLGINTCGDLQKSSLASLQSEFGNKLGSTLHKYCRGIDDKELVFHQIRKSVSAEVNYGIRFQNSTERNTFLEQLSKEVAIRLENVKMKGKAITLKLMVRSKDAPEETAKYLGHGLCDHITKASTISKATADPSVIYREILKIIDKMNVEAKELRGIGIQITRLENIINQDDGILKFINKAVKKQTEEKKIIIEKDEPRLSDSCDSVPEKRETVVNFKAGGSNRTNEHGDPCCSYSKKKDESPENTENISLSQVDESFLNAMPEDIKVEIIESLKKNKNTSEDKKATKENILLAEKNCLKNISAKNSEEVYCKIIENDENINKDVKRENENIIKRCVSPGNVRTLLKDWVECENLPLPRDILLIKDYLKDLVSSRCIEELQVILKYFHRYIKKLYKSDIWKETYMNVLDEIQSKMLNVFNGKLALEDEFKFIL